MFAWIFLFSAFEVSPERLRTALVIWQDVLGTGRAFRRFVWKPRNLSASWIRFQFSRLSISWAACKSRMFFVHPIRKVHVGSHFLAMIERLRSIWKLFSGKLFEIRASVRTNGFRIGRRPGQLQRLFSNWKSVWNLRKLLEGTFRTVTMPDKSSAWTKRLRAWRCRTLFAAANYSVKNVIYFWSKLKAVAFIWSKNLFGSLPPKTVLLFKLILSFSCVEIRFQNVHPMKSSARTVSPATAAVLLNFRAAIS